MTKTPDGKPFPFVAYTGVDGKNYLVPVPVKSVWLNRAEGPSSECVAHTFHGPQALVDADIQLSRNSITAPKSGGYDKHDFHVEWIDNSTYSGRFDLEGDDPSPSIGKHIRQYLRFLLDTDVPHFTPNKEERQEILSYFNKQGISEFAVPAPEGTTVVHDYRENYIVIYELQRKHYGHILDD